MDQKLNRYYSLHENAITRSVFLYIFEYLSNDYVFQLDITKSFVRFFLNISQNAEIPNKLSSVQYFEIFPAKNLSSDLVFLSIITEILNYLIFLASIIH